MRRLAGVDRCGVVVLDCRWRLVYMWSGPAIDVAVNFEVDSHQRQERPPRARDGTTRALASELKGKKMRERDET
jgi:hypothetical protein